MGITSSTLERMIASGEFRFNHLVLRDIDNTQVIRINAPDMVEQEICLFHENTEIGDEYVKQLHDFIRSGIEDRRPLPVVRFADGEYAFYRCSLHCNGLYRQAESVEAIRTAMPFHLEALKILAEQGKFAPLIFPGNTRKKKKGFLSILRRSKSDNSAAEFLDFLSREGIAMTGMNYTPFYVIYAYLTSKDFVHLVDGKRVCILNAEFNRHSCTDWFARFSSHPHLSFVETAAEYVATRWESMKEGILKQIPPDTDLCIVGAGIGSLPVCADVAQRFSIPAIDAGHVLNMMNDRVDKSNGPRLYTIRKMENHSR